MSTPSNNQSTNEPRRRILLIAGIGVAVIVVAVVGIAAYRTWFANPSVTPVPMPVATLVQEPPLQGVVTVVTDPGWVGASVPAPAALAANIPFIPSAWWLRAAGNSTLSRTFWIPQGETVAITALRFNIAASQPGLTLLLNDKLVENLPQIASSGTQFEITDVSQIRSLVNQGQNTLKMQFAGTTEPVDVTLALEAAYTYQRNDLISIQYLTNTTWQIDSCVLRFPQCPDTQLGFMGRDTVRQATVAFRGASSSNVFNAFNAVNAATYTLTISGGQLQAVAVNGRSLPLSGGDPSRQVTINTNGDELQNSRTYQMNITYTASGSASSIIIDVNILARTIFGGQQQLLVTRIVQNQEYIDPIVQVGQGGLTVPEASQLTTITRNFSATNDMTASLQIAADQATIEEVRINGTRLEADENGSYSVFIQTGNNRLDITYRSINQNIAALRPQLVSQESDGGQILATVDQNWRYAQQTAPSPEQSSLISSNLWASLPGAIWIWNSHDDERDRFDGGVLKDIELPQDAVVLSADFFGAIDDGVLVTAVNDLPAVLPRQNTAGGEYTTAHSYPLLPEGFKSGSNRITIRYENVGGAAGVMGQVRMTYFVPIQ